MHQGTDIFQQPRWSPPPDDMVCMHVDAALFPSDRSMGWGTVLRDHQGNFLLSCMEGLAGLPEPELAEGIAFRRALQVLLDNGF